MVNNTQEAKIGFEPAFVPESLIIVPLSRSSSVPTQDFSAPRFNPEDNPLILNIETSGFNPLTDRIISIGFMDPALDLPEPTIIMKDDEGQMLNELFTVIKQFGYNQLVGYGLSFDFRFIVLKAMKHGLTCQEFAQIGIYDLMQAMAQVKFEFMYFPQKAINLSDVSDFFWNFPKPFTDLEMLKFWKSGRNDKVLDFSRSQIWRISLLYSLFRGITENPIIPIASGGVSSTSIEDKTTPNEEPSKLTIPEASAPKTWLAKCEKDLSEWNVSVDLHEFVCPIDKTIIKRPQ